MESLTTWDADANASLIVSTRLRPSVCPSDDSTWRRAMATRSFSRGRGRWFLVGVLLSCGAAAQAASAALPPPAIVTGQDAGWPEVRAWTADGAQAQGGA